MTAMIALLHRLGLQDDTAERAFQSRLAAMTLRQNSGARRPSPFRFAAPKAAAF